MKDKEFEEIERLELELSPIVAKAEAAWLLAEDERATKRYVDELIDGGREDQLVDGMPAWLYKALNDSEEGK